MFTGYVYEKRRISDKGQVWLNSNNFILEITSSANRMNM